MPATDPIERYLTEQVVGPATLLVLGPSQGVREASDRALRLDWLDDRGRLLRGLARGLVSRDAAAPLAGHALPLAALPRLRRCLLLGLWLGWSGLLGTAVWALTRWSLG